MKAGVARKAACFFLWVSGQLSVVSWIGIPPKSVLNNVVNEYRTASGSDRVLTLNPSSKRKTNRAAIAQNGFMLGPGRYRSRFCIHRPTEMGVA
jgi:hypothetical protein